MKQVKSGSKPPGEGRDKKLVNVKDSSYSIIMDIPTKEWYDLPSPELMFYQTSSQEVLVMYSNTDESQESL